MGVAKILRYASPCVVATAALVGSTALADTDAAAFFEDREIQMIVGSDAGSQYDLYARVLMDHITKHLPGEVTFVPAYMPAAGSAAAMNYLYNVAEQDGSVIGAINPGAVTTPLLFPDQANYDSREFHWLGSIMRDTEVIVVWHDVPVQTIDAAMETEIMVGGTGGASSVLPTLLNGVLDTQFRVIDGFNGLGEAFLSMERGEIHGIGASSLSNLVTNYQEMLDAGDINILAQYGLAPSAELDGIPTVMDYVTSDAQESAFRLMLTRQEIGRPFLLPPDVPEDIVAIYEEAFAATMADDAFIEDLQSRRLSYDPQTGETLDMLIAGLYDAPDDVIEDVRDFLGARQ